MNHGEDSAFAVSIQEDWRVRKDDGKLEFGLVAQQGFLYSLDTVLFRRTESGWLVVNCVDYFSKCCSLGGKGTLLF